MITKKYNDIIAGVLLIVITIFYFSGTFLENAFQLSKYGADFVPRIYCIIMTITSIALIVKGTYGLKNYKDEDKEKVEINMNFLKELGITIFIIVIYIALINRIGFVIMTAFYLTCQTFVLAPKAKRKPVMFVLFSIVSSVVIDYIFVNLFYVSLPKGILGF